MVLEYGHIYYEDILNRTIPVLDIRKSIVSALSYINNNIDEEFKKVVLIDDKNYTLNEIEKDEASLFVLNYYRELGLAPDLIYFEKVFYEKVCRIYSSIPKEILKVEYFRKEKKYVEFLCNENYKIPLKSIRNGNVSYSCQMLASLWTLEKSEIYSDRKVITVLSEKYQKVEMQIIELLRLSGYSVNNFHIWH